MDIVFVILNYNTYIETVECIESIEDKIDTEDYKIIIVDNGSKDDSANLLCEFITGKNKIELIRIGQNLGFAKGNNVGISYANKIYKSKFLVVLNSDTELIQRDLLSKLNKEYQNSKFSLLGPLVLNADGRCDNSPHFPPTVDHLETELELFQKEKKIIKSGLYRPYCAFRFIQRVFAQKLLKRQKPIHRNMEFHKYQRQVVLQGCFLVFSQKVFDYIDGFDDRTFLYYEEPLLYLKLMDYKLITVYDPEICIYHKDGRASQTINKISKKKMLFINQCYQESCEILLNEIKNHAQEQG